MSAVEEMDQERRITFCLYEYWEKLAGGAGLPALKNMQKSEIELFKKNLVLLDLRNGNNQPSFQVIGQDLTEDLDVDLVGRSVTEVPRRTMLSRVTDHYQEVLANRVPIAFEAEFVNRDGEKALYRGILLPFSDDNNHINFIMGGVRWILEKDVTLDESKPTIEELMRTIAAGRDDQAPTIEEEQVAAESQEASTVLEDHLDGEQFENIETVPHPADTQETSQHEELDPSDGAIEFTDEVSSEISEPSKIDVEEEEAVTLNEPMDDDLLDDGIILGTDDTTEAILTEAPEEELDLVDELVPEIEEASLKNDSQSHLDENENDETVSFHDTIEKELSGETQDTSLYTEEESLDDPAEELGDQSVISLENDEEEDLYIDKNILHPVDQNEALEDKDYSNISENEGSSVPHSTLEELLASDNEAEEDILESTDEIENLSELDTPLTDKIDAANAEDIIDPAAEVNEVAEISEDTPSPLSQEEDASPVEDEISLDPDEIENTVEFEPEISEINDELSTASENENIASDSSDETFEVDDEDDLSIEQLMQSIIKERKFEPPIDSEDQDEKDRLLDNDYGEVDAKEIVDEIDKDVVEEQPDAFAIEPQETDLDVITFEPEDTPEIGADEVIQEDLDTLPEITDQNQIRDEPSDQAVTVEAPIADIVPENEQIIDKKPKRANVIERAMEKMFPAPPFMKNDSSANNQSPQEPITMDSTASEDVNQNSDISASAAEVDNSTEQNSTNDVPSETTTLEEHEAKDDVDFLELDDEAEPFDEKLVDELLETSDQAIEENTESTDELSLGQTDEFISTDEPVEEISMEDEVVNESVSDDGENESELLASNAEELSLPELRAALRQITGYIKKEDANHNRSRDSLYNILTAIYKFHGTCEKSPEAFKQIVAEHELKIQERAPFTPVLKICLGKDYDKTRLTEYAAALGIAEYMNVDISEFHAFIKNFPGGIKGCVKEMRAIRKHGASGNITARKTRSVEEAREILREMEPITSFRLKKVIVGNNVDEFCLLLAKRDGHNIDVLKILDDKHTKLDPILKRTAFLKGNINDRK